MSPRISASVSPAPGWPWPIFVTNQPHAQSPRPGLKTFSRNSFGNNFPEDNAWFACLAVPAAIHANFFAIFQFDLWASTGDHGAMQTIVIGHRNPDMDSICSALAYARLKQLLGTPDVIAARAGNTNARIDYVLA